jgi:hypothetical protein
VSIICFRTGYPSEQIDRLVKTESRSIIHPLTTIQDHLLIISRCKTRV